MPVKFDLKKYKNKIYVETGLFMGESLKKALDSGFEILHSIDINKNYIEQSERNFRTEISENKIFLHLGSSTEVLPNLLSKIDEKVTFYLDAHDLDYPGIEKNKYEIIEECPIIRELETIKNHNIKNHTIMIDDLRMFENNYGWASGYEITIDVIKNKILEINSNYKFIFEEGIEQNDVLVAFI